jgi:2-oxoglutarate ferredoxin oxidoreductase subunit alpha
MHTVTGLAHDRASAVAYGPAPNEEGIRHRSLKLVALQKALKPPRVHGASNGDLLIVGWGSTRGAIEEAVDRLRADGQDVSSLHLTFLQPMHGGLKEIFQQFKRVMAVEGNWSDLIEDELVTEENRRYSNLGWLLRARYLIDVDCWGQVGGQPIKPGSIVAAARLRLGQAANRAPRTPHAARAV